MKSSKNLLVVNILIVFGFSLTTSAQTEEVPNRFDRAQSYTNQPLQSDREGLNPYVAPRNSVPLLSGESDTRVSPAEVIPGDDRIVTETPIDRTVTKIPLGVETIERTPSTSNLETLSRDLTTLSRERETVGNQNDDRLDNVNRSRDRDRNRDRDRVERDAYRSTIDAANRSQELIEGGVYLPFQTRTRERNDIGDDMDRLSDLLGPGVFEIGDPPIYSQAKTCKDGDVRYPDANDVKKFTWTLPKPGQPTVEITSDSDQGHYAEPGAENFFEPFKHWPSIPGDRGAGEIVRTGAEVGDAGAKGAKRWADRNNKKIVDLTVTIGVRNVIVECTEVEVCVSGAWKAQGLKPIKETETPRAPMVHSASGLMGAELPKELAKAQRKAQRLSDAFAKYSADPCQGASSAGGQSSGGNGPTGGPSTSGGGGTKGAGGGKPEPKKNCQPILDEHRVIFEQLKKAINDHAEAHLPILDLEVEKAKLELDWSKESDAAQKALDAANKELKDAESYFKGLLANPPAGDAEATKRWTAAVDRAQARANAASKAAIDAEAAVKNVDAKYAPKVAAVDAKLVIAKEKLEQLRKEVERLRKAEEAKMAEYIACINS